MNQEKAILHFNKFKNLRNVRVKDTVNGSVYIIQKPRLEKINEDDYHVWVSVTNEISEQNQEFQSEYANSFFKEF